MTIISQRLYIRVAIAIAFVAVLASLIASALSYYLSLNQKQQTYYLLVEQLAATVEKTAAVAAYINDTELAQEIVNGLLINDLVKGATLSNDVDLNVKIGDTPENSERISIGLGHPFLADTQVGILSIHLDDKFIKNETQNASQKEIILLVTHSIIIAFFVSILVHRRLTKPIQNLIDNFDMVDPSSPKTMRMLEHKRNDEIGKLTMGINALIQELHQAFSIERNLRIKTQVLESKFRLIFEQASAGICLMDENDHINYFNHSFSDYFNHLDDEEATGKSFPDLFSNPDNVRKLLKEIRTKDNVDQIALDMECQVNGTTKWLHCLFAKVIDQRKVNREPSDALIQVILYDVTERAERELQTRFEADHDLLTHLMNRRSGEKKLHKLLYFSIKHQQPFVLMMIDLDKFKPVNDAYGHEAGDRVLLEIAKRIKSRFNEESSCIIRWGGDEFVVAYSAPTVDENQVRRQAKAMLLDIQRPIKIQPEESCSVDASIGIVVAPKHGNVLHDLLVNADNTMYKVKEEGRGRVEVYTPKE